MRILIWFCIPIYSYLMGSISTAVLVSRVMFGQDIRDYGSGNAGMTNALRVYGKRAAFITAFGDLAKAMLSLLLTKLLLSAVLQQSEEITTIGVCLSALFVVLGHIFPLYFGFRGGKGVLTTLGIWLFIDWRVALLGFAFFALVVYFTRYVSLGSILAMIFLVCMNILCGFSNAHGVFWPQIALGAIIGVLCIFMHRANLHRLMEGTESKLGQHTKEKTN